jgi:hypothetical protein
LIPIIGATVTVTVSTCTQAAFFRFAYVAGAAVVCVLALIAIVIAAIGFAIGTCSQAAFFRFAYVAGTTGIFDAAFFAKHFATPAIVFVLVVKAHAFSFGVVNIVAGVCYFVFCHFKRAFFAACRKRNGRS